MPQAPAKAARSMEKIDKEASMLRPALLSAVFLLSAPALAQNYGGTYTAKNASGGNVMLTLTQDGQKRVNGTLTGYGSSSLQVQARAESDGLRGTAANSFGMLYLTGRVDGDEISIVLTESDVGGKPNPQKARELRLAKLPAKVALPEGELSPHAQRLVQLRLRHRRQPQQGAPGLHAERPGHADAGQAVALARAERNPRALRRRPELDAAASAAGPELERQRGPAVAQQGILAVRLAPLRGVAVREALLRAVS